MGRIVRIIIAGFMLVGLASGSSVWAQSLDELHKAAAKEGALNFYATLAQINAEIVLPTFEKRFPGIKINHVDATSDKLVARAVSEARGGKTKGRNERRGLWHGRGLTAWSSSTTTSALASR